MSKTVKNLISKTYAKQFGDLTDAMVIDIRGIEANDNNELRTDLIGKQIRITVVKNSLAKATFKGTKLEPLNEYLEGPAAIAYGGESVVNVARVLIDWAKKLEHLELKGAVLDGLPFGPDQIKALSEYPTKEEAQAQVIQVVLGPGSQVAGALVGVGNEIAGILKSIEEKLEDGEQIAKVA